MPIKIIDDEEEIMKRLLRSPKRELLYKDYSEIISKCTRNIKSPFKKSISNTTKTAILIPLSPVQIYKVHIYPTTFAFGMVSNPKYDIVIRKIDQTFKKITKFIRKLIITKKDFILLRERDNIQVNLFIIVDKFIFVPSFRLIYLSIIEKLLYYKRIHKNLFLRCCKL